MTVTTLLCACQVTDEFLLGHGIVTEKREKSMGSEHVTRAGVTAKAALREARRRGLVLPLFCAHASERTKARIAARAAGVTGVAARKVDAETLAWFLGTKAA